MASKALIRTSRPTTLLGSDETLGSATRLGDTAADGSTQFNDPIERLASTAPVNARRGRSSSMKRVEFLAAVLLSTVLICRAQGGTSATAVIPATLAKNTYVIGPADVLSITVWKEPALSETIPVRPDGMVSMALLGDLQAAGFTPMQLTEDVTNRLKHFVQDPRVSVVVTAVNSQRVFLLGEIAHAGPVPLTPGMTALQAISTGGGLTQFANVKKIYVIRDENGKQEKIAVKYKQALRGDTNENVVLRSGDTIVVP
jgi:polysaccharide export outer membrane protein